MVVYLVNYGRIPCELSKYVMFNSKLFALKLILND